MRADSWSLPRVSQSGQHSEMAWTLSHWSAGWWPALMHPQVLGTGSLSEQTGTKDDGTSGGRQRRWGRLPGGRLCPLQLLPSSGPARGHRELACPLDCRSPQDRPALPGPAPAPAGPRCRSGAQCHCLQRPPAPWLCCWLPLWTCLWVCVPGQCPRVGVCVSRTNTSLCSEFAAARERASERGWAPLHSTIRCGR